MFVYFILKIPLHNAKLYFIFVPDPEDLLFTAADVSLSQHIASLED